MFAGFGEEDSFAAADAWAHSDTSGIGGWWSPSLPHEPRNIHWFHMDITRKDLPDWWGVDRDLQKSIAALEALAQAVLLELRCNSLGNNKLLRVEMAQQSDNMGVVGCAAKWSCSKAPLCFAMQSLAYQASSRGVRVSIDHICGARNSWADKISRLSLPEGKPFRNELDESKRHEVVLRKFTEEPWK